MKANRPFFIFLGLWIMIFSGIKTIQHLSFGTNACDLSTVDYGFHYTLKGEIMADPFHQYAFGRWEREGGMLTYAPGRVKGWESHFALHFSPILFLFIPLYIIFPGPLVLLIIEVVAVGLSGLFLYLIARDVLKNWFFAFAVAVVYLLFRQMLLGLMHDFHPEMLFPVFFLAGYYFLTVRRKPLFYFLCLGLSLLVKEDIGIYLFFFGIFAVYKLREKRIGWWTSALSLGYVLLALGLIIPYFRQQAGAVGFYLYGASYGQEGGNLFQIIGNILKHPGVLLRGVDFGRFFRILATNILLPLLFLPLLSPFALLLLPPLAVMIASKIPQMYTFGLHYSMTLLPFLFLALIHGIKNVDKAFLTSRWRKASSCLFVLAIIFLAVNLSNSSFWRIISPSRYQALSSYKGVMRLIAQIPPEASVSAQSALIPHIPKRKRIAMLPAYNGEEFILVHGGVNLWPYTAEEYNKFVTTIEHNPDYSLISQYGKAKLFKRIKGSMKGTFTSTPEFPTMKSGTST